MGSHADGQGSTWTEASPDIDQPHGLDYRALQDIRRGVRKRLEQEHVTFAAATAGGVHKPGGCAVLAMDITNAAGDPTGNVVADGTYRGHGLAWTYVVQAGANKGLLWCATAAAGTSTTGDWTLVKLHPDLQWGGGDVTWQGAHEFDGSIDITGPVWVDGSCDFSDVHVAGDLTVAGAVLVDGSCDFSDVYVEGDLTVKGDLKVDSTATEFGEGAGVCLFYDPTTYAGAESTTLPNGTIIKTGTENNVAATTTVDVNYAAAFNAACTPVVFVTFETATATTAPCTALPKAAAENATVQIRNNHNAARNINWVAIGY